MISSNWEISETPPNLALSDSRLGVLTTSKTNPKALGVGVGVGVERVCNVDPWDAKAEEQRVQG